MKKAFPFSIWIAASLAALNPVMVYAAEPNGSHNGVRTALILFWILTVLLAGFSAYVTSLVVRAAKKRRHAVSNANSGKTMVMILYIATGISLLVAIVFAVLFCNDHHTTSHVETLPQTTAATTEATEPAETGFVPVRDKKNDPANLGIHWELINNGMIVDSFKRQEPITFGDPSEFYPLPGISTFRGNNYRNDPTYGTIHIAEQKLTPIWDHTIGSLNGWPGCGWTGQPLIVQWDEETKSVMNLYADKKAKADLIEVIYATLDGHIYFYDLENGDPTRDPINLGMNFKGAGSLDSRGYPIMYVGSGDKIDGSDPRMFIVSLVDGSILYEKSGKDAFAQRDWVAFDSAPLVDPETDTLIWTGESGIIYTIKLNTRYDPAAGTLTMNPQEIIKSRYTTPKYTKDGYWIGFEPSAVMLNHYLLTSDNAGIFFCIDINTMEPVWATDTLDDSNSTPVLEERSDGNTYLYTAPSLHWTASNHDDLRNPKPTDPSEPTDPDATEETRPTTGSGSISVYKLDARTGEIIWQVPFDCYTVEGVSGGVQSSPVLGKPGTELDGLILYTIARTPTVDEGKLVAFHTDDGSIAWELPMTNYAWSSPVALYNADGTAYIIICDSMGNMSMVNAEGKVVTTINLGSNIEASPAVFNDTLVVGTRAGKIYGIRIS